MSSKPRSWSSLLTLVSFWMLSLSPAVAGRSGYQIYIGGRIAGSETVSGKVIGTGIAVSGRGWMRERRGLVRTRYRALAQAPAMRPVACTFVRDEAGRSGKRRRFSLKMKTRGKSLVVRGALRKTIAIDCKTVFFEPSCLGMYVFAIQAYDRSRLGRQDSRAVSLHDARVRDLFVDYRGLDAPGGARLRKFLFQWDGGRAMVWCDAYDRIVRVKRPDMHYDAFLEGWHDKFVSPPGVSAGGAVAEACRTIEAAVPCRESVVRVLLTVPVTGDIACSVVIADLHGASRDDGFVEKLAAGGAAVLRCGPFIRHGSGRSVSIGSGGKWKTRFERDSDVLAAACDYLESRHDTGGKDLFLLSFGFSAPVIAEVARRLKHKPQGLVFVSPPVKSIARSLVLQVGGILDRDGVDRYYREKTLRRLSRLLQAIDEGRGVDAELRDLVPGAPLFGRVVALGDALSGYLHRSLKDFLSSCKLPVLVIRGRDDAVLSEAVSAAAAEAALMDGVGEDYRVLRSPGAGFLLFRSGAGGLDEKAMASVSEWLAEHEPLFIPRAGKSPGH